MLSTVQLQNILASSLPILVTYNIFLETKINVLSQTNEETLKICVHIHTKPNTSMTQTGKVMKRIANIGLQAKSIRPQP